MLKAATTAGVISEAVQLLAAGQLVAFPTETVYGLGADASNIEALAKIYAAKGRPSHHPLIVHIAELAQLTDWAVDIPAMAYRLAEAFWPGPLTLILKRAPSVNAVVTGGQASIGLRMPAHPVAQALLQAWQGGIAAPSANSFGRLSPSLAQHVEADLGSRVDLIIDGGPCSVGIESTIIDCTQATLRILRQGVITASQIQAVALQPLAAEVSYNTIRASGMLPWHYAPKTPLQILSLPALMTLLAEASASQRMVVLARYPKPSQLKAVDWWVMPAEPAEYAACLYATLHELDKLGFAKILVAQLPAQEAWLSITDRLVKAAAKFANE